MKKFIGIFVAVLILILAGFICIRFYSYVFSKTVSGQVMKVERASQASAVITQGGGSRDDVPRAQLFSFAVAIRQPSGEIFTASSEDRQWAVVRPGQCVEAKLFPYPFWELDKGGTYFNARLDKIYDCPGAPAGTPPVAPSPQVGTGL